MSTPYSPKLKRYWHECGWNVWSPRREPLPPAANVHWRIAFCTVCMGRTHDLARTLVTNIEANDGYPHLEFVLLNYNSDDGLDDFMASASVEPHLRSGRLKYFRTRIPRYFHASHSRNIAFRHAQADIVCNVDADNFTGPGFAAHINLLANIRSRRVVFARGKRRLHGRIAMFKDEFEEMGGYDEELIGYGGDDHSLMLRAMNSGFTLMWWNRFPVNFMERIVTPRDKVAELYAVTDWRLTERRNRETIMRKLQQGTCIVNVGQDWGCISDLERVG